VSDSYLVIQESILVTVLSA